MKTKIIITIIIGLILIIGFIYFFNKPEFKIIYNGEEVDEVKINSLCYPNGCFVTENGNMYFDIIGKSNLTIEWLDEKCVKKLNGDKYCTYNPFKLDEKHCRVNPTWNCSNYIIYQR